MSRGDAPVAAPRALILDAAPAGPRGLANWSETVIALMLCLLVFGGHLAIGAARRDLAMALVSAYGALLAIVLVGFGWARRSFARIGGLSAEGALFCGVLLMALWSLTPWGLGGPHPVWSYVDGPPATVLDRSSTLMELIRLLGLACVFLIAWLLGSDDHRARRWLNLLVLFSAAFAVWAFVAHVTGTPAHFGIASRPHTVGRLSATFLSANTAGAFFGVCAVLGACAVTDALRSRGDDVRGAARRRWGSGIAGAVGFIFSFVCLMLTASRGAFLATIVPVGAFFVWEALARRWRLLGLGGLALLTPIAALIGLLAIAGTPLVHRLNQSDLLLASRGDLTLAHWQAFLASPWLGYGLGGFDAINKLVTTGQNYPSLWDVHAAHNVYLQWLEEAGVLGAALMFLCLGSLLSKVVFGAVRRVRMTTWLRGLAAASLVVLIQGVSDFALQIPSIAAFWAALLGTGVGIAMNSAPRR